MKEILKKLAVIVPSILFVGLILISCIRTPSEFNASGLSFEGVSDKGDTFVVMFKNGVKQVFSFDSEGKIIEMWRMKCKIVKWDWYGFCFYVKPSPFGPDKSSNPISTLFRIRIKEMHDTPTTIYESIESGCGLSTGYYSKLKEGDSLTESAVFKKDGSLELGDSRLNKSKMDRESFDALWNALENAFNKGMSSELIGKKMSVGS